jgi:hypothetical protein
MAYFWGIIILIVAAWMISVPVSEYRHATQTGEQRLPFSQMLLRMGAAFSILMIGLMVFFSPILLPGRTPLFEIFYWLGVLFFACVMLVAGYTDQLFVKRSLLLHQRDLIQEFVRRNEQPQREE